MAITGTTTRVIKIPAADAGAITTEYITVKAFRWVGATTAGHVCTVTDTAGNTVWSSVADAANYVDVMYIFDRFNGLIASAIGSGTLYVYIL